MKRHHWPLIWSKSVLPRMDHISFKFTFAISILYNIMQTSATRSLVKLRLRKIRLYEKQEIFNINNSLRNVFSSANLSVNFLNRSNKTRVLFCKHLEQIKQIIALAEIYYSVTITVIRHPRCFRQGALTPRSSANDRIDRVYRAQKARSRRWG